MWIVCLHLAAKLPRSLFWSVMLPLDLHPMNGSGSELLFLGVNDGKWFGDVRSVWLTVEWLIVQNVSWVLYILLQHGDMEDIMNS
ncbi:hypothetical protein AAC387_Pa07g3157 [Persea americana]